MESSDSYEVISSVSSTVSELILVEETCLNVDLGSGLVSRRRDWPEVLGESIEIGMLGSGGVVFRPTAAYAELHPPVSTDPTQLLYYLHFHPFHVETLERISLHYEKLGEWDLAEGTLEHILYVYQVALAKSGLVLSDISVQATAGRLNMLFLESLHRLTAMHIRRKALDRAFELSKLQLRLRTGNELDCILLVEKLAVETGAWSFLHSFHERYASEFHGEGELLWLPSSLYTSALARVMERGEVPMVTSQDVVECEEVGSFQEIGRVTPSAELMIAVSLYPCVASLLLGRRLSPERQSQTDSSPLGNIRQLSYIYAELFASLWSGPPLQWLNSVWLRAPSQSRLLSQVRPIIRLPTPRKTVPEPACGAPLWALLGAVFSWTND